MTTATTINAIVTKLNEVLADADAAHLAKSQEWAAKTAIRIREFKASDEARTMARRGQAEYYETLFAMAGGKGWYEVFNGRSLEMIAEYVIKNCAALVAKRNATVAAKLEKAGVNEVVSEEYTRTNDGFNGVYVVGTDNGNKSVEISTIYAGGYNVQCLHTRTLVKVR